MSTAATLSRTGYPKGGRPAKIRNPHRWHLVVDRDVRDRATLRAAGDGRDLTDVLRALLADYEAGRLAPTTEGLADAGVGTR